MRFTIAAVGRLKSGPERELYDRYADRILRMGRSYGLGPLEFIEVMEDRAANAAQRMQVEGRQLLDKTANCERRIVLDERGDMISSAEFATFIGDLRDVGVQTTGFFIGGADGHAASVREAGDKVLSLGRMTLPHGLARVLLAEQLYRSLTLLAGHPYHRD